MTPDYELTQRIDTEELTRIKNTFQLKNRINADRYELNKLSKENPTILFNAGSTKEQFTSGATLQGLSYPLELDGKGGLKISSNYDRVGEQILEVLQTRIGERVFRPFFGIPELIFETIDEGILAQSIKSQIKASLPIEPELEVRVDIEEYGSAMIYVWYSIGGSDRSLVKYSFSA